MIRNTTTRAAAALALAASALLTGCATAPKTLYQWEGYQPQVYQYLKGESPEQQIAAMEKDLQLISAKGNMVPPGFHAHLGMLYSVAGTPDQVAAEFEAEAGYYVLPVAVVGETFKQNGLTSAADIHAVDIKKLDEIFGADAALYVTISNYGATYTVINSVVVVSVNAKLVDIKTGNVLWTGAASASNNEGGNSGGGGLVGALVAAAVKQIINNVSDTSHPVAGVANARLLTAGQANGILYGPRSEHYLKQ